MGQASQTPNEVMFIAVYTFSVAFYMPTLGIVKYFGIQYIEEQRARHREGFSANPCVRNRGLHPHDVDCELCYLGQRFILVPVERERP